MSARFRPALAFAALLLASSFFAPRAFSQTAADPNEGLSLRQESAVDHVYSINWWGRAGRTYFIQRSTDLVSPWQYMPVIETGHDAPVAYGFSDESPRVFVRLRYVDQTYADPFSTDIDGDGLTNDEEFSHQTDPFSTDTDLDLIDDKTELSLFILNGGDEWSRPVLRPAKADSDDNGILDGLEDYDGDGLTILQEIALGTSPNKTDTDTDGVSDGRELSLGTSPLANDHFAALDTDGDGLTDLEEIIIGTDRHDPDTNDNGMDDGPEFDLGGAPATPGAPVPAIPPPGLPPSPDPQPAPPAPPAPPAAPPALPPAAHRLLVRAVSASHVKHGFAPYQELSPPRRYLTETLSQHFSGGCPESGPLDTSGDKVREIDPDDGWLVESGDDHVAGGGDIRSPYVRRGSVELDYYDDPPNVENDCPGSLAVSAVLSDENTTAMLREATKEKLPAYSQEAPDDGYREVPPHAYRALRDDELGYAYQRAQVKFAWPANTPEAARHPVAYLVLFEPADDPDTTENESASPEALAAWTWDGAAPESPVWELDPDTLLPGDRDGRFVLSPLRLYADSGSVHLGFDPPNPSENDPLDEYWASVVQGASNTILNLDLTTTAASALEWQISEADHARVEFDSTLNGPGKLVISGKNTGATQPEPATLRLVAKGGGPTFLTLNVLVLPQRVMGIAIYILEDSGAPLTQFGSSPVVPLPDNAEILAVCNDVFKQAGVRFTLHASSGTYSFPYDTRGLTALGRYSEAEPARTSDGRLSNEERRGLFEEYTDLQGVKHPSMADLLFDVKGNDANNRRIILLKESGIAYTTSDPVTGQTIELPHKVRGISGAIGLFVRNLPGQQLPLAAAHEVGHTFGKPNGLSSADDDGGGGHDQPPFAHAVANDQPNGQPPVHPGNAFVQHRPEPNRAIMQGGYPDPDGLPWVYGRWMRHEDWRKANLGAVGLSDE